MLKTNFEAILFKITSENFLSLTILYLSELQFVVVLVKSNGVIWFHVVLICFILYKLAYNATEKMDKIFFWKGGFFSSLWGYFEGLTKRLKIWFCLFNKKVIGGCSRHFLLHKQNRLCSKKTYFGSSRLISKPILIKFDILTLWPILHLLY